MEEFIVKCDETGNVIGRIEKREAHNEENRPNTTHYSTWSMVFHYPSQKYGIQLKNPKKDDKQSRGKWDMGVAGHNCYIDQENYLDFGENLEKEAKEEIGIDLKVFKTKNDFLKSVENFDSPVGFIFDKFHFKEGNNNEWVGLGIILVKEEEVNFLDDEVVDFKWLSPQELREFIDKHEGEYCSPLPMVFQKAESFIEKNLK